MSSGDQLRLELRPLVQQAAAANSIPWTGLDALIQWESGWDPLVVNARSGAIGLGQFMPDTAADLGIDPWDPQEAIEGSAAYLAWLHQQAGSWADALAAYNWGIGNVWDWQRDGRDPAALPAETRGYVAGLLSSFVGPAARRAAGGIFGGLVLYAGWRAWRAWRGYP